MRPRHEDILVISTSRVGIESKVLQGFPSCSMRQPEANKVFHWQVESVDTKIAPTPDQGNGGYFCQRRWIAQ
jgi:hypothetical protein